jgi:hypothetical protein
MEQTTKAMAEEKQFAQWRSLISKQPKADPAEKAKLIREINSLILNKARESKAQGSMNSIIADKANEINIKKSELEKLKHEFANYKPEDCAYKCTNVLFNSQEAIEKTRALLDNVGLFSPPEEEVYIDTDNREKSSLRISTEQSKSSLNKSKHGIFKCDIAKISTPKQHGSSSSVSRIGANTERSVAHKAIDDFSLSRAIASKTMKQSTTPEEELLQVIGKDKFNHLRYSFEQYCAKSNPTKAHTMDSHQFHKFLQDNTMVDDKCTMVNADLLFCKGNKTKSINFTKFCVILTDMAKCRYPEISSKITALESYLSDTIFHKNNSNCVEKNDKYEDWFIELEDKDLIKFLENNSTQLTNLFKKYVTSPEANNMMTLKAFLKFCQDMKIIPDLLSHSDCTLMFKVCQRTYTPGQDLSSLDYNEFVQCLCFQSFYYYTKVVPKKALTYIEKVKKFIYCIIHH